MWLTGCYYEIETQMSDRTLSSSSAAVLSLLDLSATFVTVNRRNLLSVLYYTVLISGKALSWFESHFTGSSFRLVLRPLFFAIYTISLGPIIRSHGFSYNCCTDSTKQRLSSHFTTPLPSDISTWMKECHLQLNLSKTELLVIPTNLSLHNDINIKITSSSLTRGTLADISAPLGALGLDVWLSEWSRSVINRKHEPQQNLSFEGERARQTK
uniref:Reverse transcriptase domain-containing protein n=1 Tax=Seriola lalandi dorsalis TaxID=1841481 RepID=A0A3B4YIU4_SERLL